MGSFDHAYPFAAVVGQDTVKKALLLCAVNPAIGGLLLAGEKGTAKSTLVRGLATLTDHTPFVELPLNATEDRLVGSLSLESALKQGQLEPEPGLLHQADGGFLYVDEINLLSEHMVNILLEVSSTGENIVEREGISFRHPTHFILVGSMNPEEGRLRPHFIDRFGLYVPCSGEKDPSIRCEILRRRLAYEANPQAFIAQWHEQSQALRHQILEAQALLPQVTLSERQRTFAAQLAVQGACAGHRADLALCEAGRALAALSGRTYVTSEDIQAMATYALIHRLRNPIALEDQLLSDEDPDRKKDNFSEEQDQDQPMDPNMDLEADPDMTQEPNQDQNKDIYQDQGLDEDQTDELPSIDKEAVLDRSPATFEAGANNPAQGKEHWEDIQPLTGKIDLGELKGPKALPKGSGKRLKVQSHSRRGRYIRAALAHEKTNDLALDATLRAAATHPKEEGPLLVTIKGQDLRMKVREQRTGASILFLVDASGSMGAMRRMGVVKGAVLSLLSDAYEKRDTVGIIAFRGTEAETLLPLTRSVDLAQKCLRQLRTGGKTPLALGLMAADQILRTDRLKNPGAQQYLVILSDGRSNVPLMTDSAQEDSLVAAKHLRYEAVKILVLDPEEGFLRFGLAKTLAEALGAEYIPLHTPSVQVLGDTVRSFLQ